MPSFSELIEETKFWIKSRGPWWATSVVAHALGLTSLAFVAVALPKPDMQDAPKFDEAKLDTEIKEKPLDKFEVGDTPIDPTNLELNADTLTLTEAPSIQGELDGSEDSEFAQEGGGTPDGDTLLGGMGGFDVKGLSSGPALKGAGGFGIGKGEGTEPGSGGKGSGFGGRSARKGNPLGTGATKQSERAVAAALAWIARHQRPDGSWAIDHLTRCTDPSCTGKGASVSDVGATALCLLPFLAAGQTHESKGPYKNTIAKGLYWLVGQQKADGNMAGNSGQVMYTHGLASICLCEAYALSYDRKLGAAAQAALNFIETAQDPQGGGWRYQPLDPGDTSVVGWQVMAMKSGKMAGLKVNDKVFEGADKFLKSCSAGNYGGLYTYMPKTGHTESMSAVGLLCIQYMGADRKDKRIQEGVSFLMKNMPVKEKPHVYYWYYATQVMHNMPGYDWDTWNRAMRKLLIETQAKNGCSAGSWDPRGHNHGEQGGRLMVTTLSCLTLEVYYRYLPLYKLDGGANKGPGVNPLNEK